jgi:hypothetical protein
MIAFYDSVLFTLYTQKTVSQTLTLHFPEFTFNGMGIG